MKSAVGIQWTVAIEITFYIFFTSVLLLPNAIAQKFLLLLSSFSILSFFFAPKARFERLTGFRIGLATEKAYVYKWFMVGVAAYFLHRCWSKQRKLIDKENMYANHLLSTICAMASITILGKLIMRIIFWHTQKTYNKWNDFEDAVIILALVLGVQWLSIVRNIFSQDFLLKIGELSYSLYLTHMFVFKKFCHHGLTGNLSPINFCLFLACSIAVSKISFHSVERPTHNLFRSRKGAKSIIPDWSRIDSTKYLPIVHPCSLKKTSNSTKLRADPTAK